MTYPESFYAHGTPVLASFTRWNPTTRTRDRITERGVIGVWPNRRDGYERVCFADGRTLELPIAALERVA